MRAGQAPSVCGSGGGGSRAAGRKGVGGHSGRARQECRGWAETNPVPAAALQLTVSFKMHKFMQWAHSIIFIFKVCSYIDIQLSIYMPLQNMYKHILKVTFLKRHKSFKILLQPVGYNLM